MKISRGLVLALAASCAVADAAVFTYPSGSAPCNGTLQACITGAASGDTIQIATNGPISETLTVDKSLTVVPATGFAPVINGSFFIFPSGSAAVSVDVESLTLNGNVRAAPNTGNLTVRIANNTVTSSDDSRPAIDISSGTFPPYGNISADVLNNTVNVTGSGDSAQCSGIMYLGAFDTGTGRTAINGNHVTISACGQGAGIMVIPGQSEALTADVLANIVTAPGTTNGIIVSNYLSTSSLSVRVINNVVSQQVNVAGAVGALVVLADGNGAIQAQVINNTVTANQNGLMVSGRDDLGATISGTVANNIVANNSDGGLQIDSAFSATVPNEYNLVFGNGFNFYTAGPGTITSDPRFISATDFHLMPAASPAIDTGNNADVPGDITTDADGKPRIQFLVVDRGAFEAGDAGRIPMLSLPGLLALAAVVALAGGLLLRRAA